VWIERELARGAASAGAIVSSVGVAPTPAIAYLTGSLDVDLGVVLSASHNPFADNGIKVFSGHGRKFGEVDEREVEAVFADSSWTVPDGATAEVGEASLMDAYLTHLGPLLPSVTRLGGARLGVDMANGATTATARRLFERLGFEVVAMGDSPTGRNINGDCGSTHPGRLADLVVKQRCRMGVAFDGDGDRAILVDAAGRIVDGDAMLLILALAYRRRGTLAGDTVVATVMSNIGLEIALKKRGIRLLRTPVGDKYVMEEMMRGHFVLGGEQSGHVILADHLHTGDGLATTLAVLGVMEESGRELADLAAELVTYPQMLVNVRVRERVPVDTVPALQLAIDRVARALDGRGRVLVRYSGTEPLLRIMIEGDDEGGVKQMAEEIAEAARTNLGQSGHG
jgi:phosphoglucosamine mutase